MTQGNPSPICKIDTFLENVSVQSNNHNGEPKTSKTSSKLSRTCKRTRRRTATRILKREADQRDHDALDEAINKHLDEAWQGVKKRPGDPEGYPMLEETVKAIKEHRESQKKETERVDKEQTVVTDEEALGEVAKTVKQFLNLFAEKKGNLNSATVTAAATASGMDPSQWEIIRAIVDSGASVPVIHPSTGQGYEVLESEASRLGVEYETAGGHSLANLGRKRLAVLTQEGTIRGYQSECAEVTKPLQSVRALLRNRHAVLFGLGDNGDQHMIVNKDTGEINWLEDDGINYIQSLMVIPPDKVEQVQAKMQEMRDELPFGRRGS